MKVSRELIEKYHEGLCSAAEKEAVENWLFNDQAEEELLLPQDEKIRRQTDIWNEIASILPAEDHEFPIPKSTVKVIPLWKRVAAAAVALMVLGSGLYFFKQSFAQPEIIVMSNPSGSMNKNLNEKEYTISVGPKSNIEINNVTGNLDFCGTVMINPKKDIELTIQGICSKNADPGEKMVLKKGLNYIALNYSSPANASEMIILEEGSMVGLPPLVMKQLLHQFNI